jgi:hypothetical protein
MTRGLKIVLGVVVAGMLAIGLFVAMPRWTQPGLVEPVERQLAALKAGNIDAAYAETSSAFRQGTSREDFGKFVDKFPILRNAASHSLTSRSVENDIGRVSGSLIAANGTLTPIAFQLVKENEAWKIVNVKLGNG